MAFAPMVTKALAIIEALRRQRDKIERMLVAFERQLAIFDDGGSPDYELIAQIIAFCVAYLSPHYFAAEKPLLLALMDQHVIDRMEAEAFEREYEEVVAGARKMGDAIEAVVLEAEVPRPTLSRIARDFINSCRRHMKTEEQFLFPVAIKSLRPEDWEAFDKSLLTTAIDSSGLACLSQRARYQTIVRWDESR